MSPLWARALRRSWAGGASGPLLTSVLVLLAVSAAAAPLFTEAAANAALARTIDAVPPTARAADSAVVRLNGGTGPSEPRQRGLLRQLDRVRGTGPPRVLAFSVGQELIPRSVRRPVVVNGDRSARARLAGVDDPAAVLDVVDADADTTGVWLPVPVADDLGVAPGDPVDLAVETKDGRGPLVPTRVAGTYAVGPDGRRPADPEGSLLWASRRGGLPLDTDGAIRSAYLAVTDPRTATELALESGDELFWTAEVRLDPTHPTLAVARETVADIEELRRDAINPDLVDIDDGPLRLGVASGIEGIVGEAGELAEATEEGTRTVGRAGVLVGLAAVLVACVLTLRLRVGELNALTALGVPARRTAALAAVELFVARAAGPAPRHRDRLRRGRRLGTSRPDHRRWARRRAPRRRDGAAGGARARRAGHRGGRRPRRPPAARGLGGAPGALAARPGGAGGRRGGRCGGASGAGARARPARPAGAARRRGRRRGPRVGGARAARAPRRAPLRPVARSRPARDGSARRPPGRRLPRRAPCRLHRRRARSRPHRRHHRPGGAVLGPGVGRFRGGHRRGPRGRRVRRLGRRRAPWVLGARPGRPGQLTSEEAEKITGPADMPAGLQTPELPRGQTVVWRAQTDIPGRTGGVDMLLVDADSFAAAASWGSSGALDGLRRRLPELAAGGQAAGDTLRAGGIVSGLPVVVVGDVGLEPGRAASVSSDFVTMDVEILDVVEVAPGRRSNRPMIVVPADPFLLAHTNFDPRLHPRPEARTARVDQFRAELWVAGGEAELDGVLEAGGIEPRKVTTADAARSVPEVVAATLGGSYQVAVGVILALMAAGALAFHADRTAAEHRAADVLLARTGIGAQGIRRARTLEVLVIGSAAALLAALTVLALTPLADRLLDPGDGGLPDLRLMVDLTDVAVLVLGTVVATTVAAAAAAARGRRPSDAEVVRDA